MRVHATSLLALVTVVGTLDAQDNRTLDDAVQQFREFPNGQCVTIPQPTAPAAVPGCSTTHDEASVRIRYDFSYWNMSDGNEGDVVAVEVLFVDFDPFNEVIGISRGVGVGRVRRGLEAGRVWIGARDWPRQLYATVAFLSRVRFASGKIWEADLERFVEAVRLIVTDLEAADRAIERLRETARRLS